MKNWLKILTGETIASATEVLAEIDNLKKEQAEVKEKLTQAKDALDKARMELYGGDIDQAGVDVLDGEAEALQIQFDTLDKAVIDLETKHGEAVEREKQAQVAEIDKKVIDLRQWMEDIRPKYIRAKVVVEAYEQLLSPTPGDGGDYLKIGHKERSEFKSEAYEITRGHGPIMGEIAKLEKQKQAILVEQ